MPKFGGVAEDQLRSIVERIEKLEEEKAALGDDIREVYAEAKGNGYDVKALRQVVKLRKMDAMERQEAALVLETYMNALGMLPLFAAPEDLEVPTASTDNPNVTITTGDGEVLYKGTTRQFERMARKASKMVETVQ